VPLVGPRVSRLFPPGPAAGRGGADCHRRRRGARLPACRRLRRRPHAAQSAPEAAILNHGRAARILDAKCASSAS
jgi:hypothetical protein